MSKINIKEIIRPTLTLFIICVIAALSLGLSNLATAAKIAENEQDKLNDSMKQVLDADTFNEIEFDGKDSDTMLYEAKKGADKVGYAALCTETGYGGKIKVMVGISNDGTINKIAIVSADDETPGLGQNVKTEAFKDRFIGISDVVAVDAWTGATISSTAVKNAVNHALELAKAQK